MPRPSPYTDEQKAAILDAVKSGRKAGKKWPEIHKDAESAGYKGGLQYLMKLARSSGAVRGRKSRNAAAPGKVGRPKGAAKRGPGRPKASASLNGSGLAGIDQIVERMVNERVRAKISAAVKALERAAGELRKV